MLNEFVTAQKFGIVIDENSIPMNDGVRALSEILGYDPLYIAFRNFNIVVGIRIAVFLRMNAKELQQKGFI